MLVRAAPLGDPDSHCDLGFRCGLLSRLGPPRQYEATEHAEKGALLRREGSHDSSIQSWRRQRDNGELTLRARPALPKKEKSAEQVELERLRKENAKVLREKELMARKLQQTEAALEIAGKWHALLEMMSESTDSEDS